MRISLHPRLPVLLMCGSLLLLLIFQGLWLRQVYDDGKNQLTREAHHAFLDAIRGVEDSLFNRFYLNPIMGGPKRIMIRKTDTTTAWVSEEGQLRSRDPDSTEAIVMFHRRMGVDSARVQIRARSEAEQASLQGEGSLSLFIALSDDSVHRHQVSSIDAYLPRIEKRLVEKMDEYQLSLDYQLLPGDGHDSSRGNTLSVSYLDLPSGQRLQANFPHATAYLLQRMLPEILFSILLFFGILLAFLLIYRSLRQQKRLTRLKNDFISNVTHELKTPITTVGVAIEALRNFQVLEDPARTEEYLDISRQELKRLSMLVDRVLKMSLFEQNALELKIEPLDLQNLVQEILASMRLQFEKLAAKVDLRIKGDNFSVEGDRLHLTSVIYNLIDNALKYSPQGPEVQIDLAAEAGSLEMGIQDSGIGIAPAYLDKIFDKFFRVPTGDRHDIKGHGLGLSYVASVVQQHQGEILVDSQPGKGTRFTIRLPRRHEG